MAVIGIDLGTTFSVVAQLDDTGRPKIVHNRDGENTTPSVVEFLDADRAEVGTEARRNRVFPGFAGASGFKREMGTSKTYEINGNTYTPTELSTLVLKKLAQDTEAALGPLDTIVVTIPANFSNEARDATLAAAKAAGLNVEHIINEPTAAALYYALQSDQNINGKYAVYDLGGGTFDISIIDVNAFEVEVLATSGVSRLGGDDFDAALLKLVQKKYKEQSGEDLNMEEYNENNAEADKKTLSTRDTARFSSRGQRFELSRTEYEEAISSLIAQTQLTCEGVMDELDMSFDALDGVFLVGGSTRTPAVKNSVSKLFGQEPVSTANVDEVVAMGAAFYSAYKTPKDNLNAIQQKVIGDVSVQERTGMCFGTIADDKDGVAKNSVIIQKNTKIPCEVTESYYTVAAGQTGVQLKVTESRAAETDPTFVNIIKEGHMTLPSGRPAQQEIKVTYRYDENQIMHCEFVDVETGKKEIFSIGINDAAVGAPAVDPESTFIVD